MTETSEIDFSGIEKVIVTVKGQNVIIDSDVARIYGTETREINKAVKNNPDKFPPDYIIDADKPNWWKFSTGLKTLNIPQCSPKLLLKKACICLPPY